MSQAKAQTRAGNLHVPHELISHNPATGEELGRVRTATEADVKAAFAAAGQAQASWAAAPVAERVKLFARWRDLMVERQDEIIALISAENGKSHGEALVGEVLSSVDTLTYFCGKAEKDLADEPVSLRILKTQKTVLVKTPFGVVGVITPWNYPFYLSVCALVPPLLAGNAVLYKPSEFTPLLGQLLHRLAMEAGIPAEVFALLQGDGQVGAWILEQPIHKVSFTGSVPTGRRIMAEAAKKPIPVTLELGGKDAMIVLEDADLDRAAKGAVWGAFANCGQICASIERVFVHEKVYDDFVDRVSALTRQLRVGGDPASYDVGPMISDRQRKIVAAQVQDALAKGATALTGGELPAGHEGHFYPPTVLVDVKSDMKVMQEETFGPLMPIVKVKDADEAVARANDCVYGLTASLWTRDDKKAMALARRLEVGNVSVNDHLGANEPPELHWGGVKQSGVGHTRGRHGLSDYVYEKVVSFDRLGLKQGQPFWFPFDPGVQKAVKKALYLFSDDTALKIKGLLK